MALNLACRGTVRDEFGRQLAEQESATVALRVDSEIRRDRDSSGSSPVARLDGDLR
jgi:hypothetical protein